MNPIAAVTQLGYRPKDILNFLLKSTGAGSLIRGLQKQGKSDNEIIQFLQNLPAGSRGIQRVSEYKSPLTESEKQAGFERKEQQRQQQSLMKGAGLAAGLYGLSQAIPGQQQPEILPPEAETAAGLSGPRPQAQLPFIQGQPPSERMQPEVSPSPEAPMTQPEQPKRDIAADLFNVLEKRGIGDNFKNFLQAVANVENSPESIAGGIEFLLNTDPEFKKGRNEIEAELGITLSQAFEEIGAEVAQVMQSRQQQTSAPKTPQEVAQEDQGQIEAATAEEIGTPTKVDPGNDPRRSIAEQISWNTLDFMTQPTKAVSGRAQDITPVKSSNTRAVHYDRANKKLRTLFGGGTIYEYDDVPEENVRNFLEGNSQTVTEGETEFRAYIQGKPKSIGSAFDKYIKKPGFEYRKLDLDKDQIENNLANVRQADSVHKATGFFEAFDALRDKPKAKDLLPGVMKKLDDSLRGLLSEDLQIGEQIIYETLRELRQELKPSQQRTPTRIAKRLKEKYGRKESNGKKRTKTRKGP